MKLTVSKDHAPPAVATPAGLPDVSSQLATRHNAKLLWQACRAVTAGSGTPNIRNGRPGVLVQVNVSRVMENMWDGYDKSPLHSPSAAARVALYKYLREATDMVCVTRRAGDGSSWWVATDWQDRPHAGGTYAERKLTAHEAGEDREPAPVEVRRVAVPDVAGVVAEDDANAATEAKCATTETTYSDDPVVAVEALVGEVRRLRALTSNNDLVEENRYLRSELDDVLARNAKLRQRLEAADKVLGRR